MDGWVLVLGAWLAVAVATACLIGGAVRLADRKARDVAHASGGPRFRASAPRVTARPQAGREETARDSTA
jgi:hypothetical protein